MPLDSLFRSDTPATPVRGVHLDLKGCPPTPERLLSLLDVFAAARYNAVLVEWEDAFPWTVDERFRSETAYSPDEVAAFLARCNELGIAVVPLVQCLGHMETPLSVAGYERLREVPEKVDVLNPLADGARELVQNMVDDVLALMPNVKHFHLGGDEAWSFGTHPDTKAYIEEHGKGALYLHHIEPILDSLSARGVRPILWHDMMREWDDAALDHLAKKADLLTWGYGGHPDTVNHHYSTKVIERFAGRGITLWGGTAYKGADGQDSDLPNIENRQTNALAWIEIAQRFNYAGVFATAWSRYSTHRMQCEPIDAALDSLVNVGAILHDGQPPAGGVDACVAALDEIGERDRFVACKSAMEKLRNARRAGWEAAAMLHSAITLAEQDTRRYGTCVDFLSRFRAQVANAQQACEDTRAAFGGLMPPIWIERYLGERVEPLREQLAALEPRARAVSQAAT